MCGVSVGAEEEQFNASMMLDLEERCCLHCNANKGVLQCGKY